MANHSSILAWRIPWTEEHVVCRILSTFSLSSDSPNSHWGISPILAFFFLEILFTEEDKNCKEKGTLCSVGNVNQCSHCGHFMDNFLQLHKKSKTELSYDPAILLLGIYTRSDQIRSVTQLCPTLCDPMNHSTPGLPVYHLFPDFTQTHVHRVSDAI